MAGGRYGKKKAIYLIVFIENFFGLYVVYSSSYLSSKKVVRIADKKLAIGDVYLNQLRGRTIFLDSRNLKILKRVCALLQFPIVQQDPLSKNFRFNLWKMILSDGLLTDCLVEDLNIKARRFYSVRTDTADDSPAVNMTAIIGSNWLEFGSMTKKAYSDHLRWMASHYSNAVYFCHPKERNGLPESIFGKSRVVHPNMPVELYFAQNGFPEKLVSVCSSSMLSIGLLRRCRMEMEMIVLASDNYDGSVHDSVYEMPNGKSGRGATTISDIQEYLERRLRQAGVPLSIQDGP